MSHRITGTQLPPSSLTRRSKNGSEKMECTRSPGTLPISIQTNKTFQTTTWFGRGEYNNAQTVKTSSSLGTLIFCSRKKKQSNILYGNWQQNEEMNNPKWGLGVLAQSKDGCTEMALASLQAKEKGQDCVSITLRWHAVFTYESFAFAYTMVWRILMHLSA